MAARSKASRGIAMSLMVIMASGCSTWRREPGIPREVILRDRPDHVRLTDAAGTRLEIRNPTVRGDSITGLPMGMPVASVVELETREFSMGRTVGLIAVAVPVALVAFIAVACATDDVEGGCYVVGGP
jgi:hypothetical protein